MHEVLVNRLFKLAQEKVWLGELTVPVMTIAVDWDVQQQQKKNTGTLKYQNMCSLCYILNQWRDFDQTCIGTLLEEWEELIIFW